jgi:hypothetical protein
LALPIKDCCSAEKKIIKRFKEKYIHMTEYGAEYFKGDKYEMCIDIMAIVNKIILGYKVCNPPIKRVDSIKEPKPIDDTSKKVCTQCGENKPLEQYGKHSSSKNGLRAYCKTCQRNYDKNRYLSKTTQITITTKDQVKVIDITQNDEWDNPPEPETMTDHISSESDDE